MAVPPMRRPVRLGWTVALAVVYFATARASLLLALPPSSATAVWPATGLALAAVLILGSQIWPGIALGAFVTNVAVSVGHHVALPVALWTSVAIAVGNTSEALLGGYLVRRFAGGTEAFDRADGVLEFLVVVLLSAAISATVGATTLGLGRIVPWTIYGVVWSTWWLGDSVGALAFTPLLVAWARGRPFALRPSQVGEAALLLILLAGISQVVFLSAYPLIYLLVPVLLWAAFRFGHRGAATMTVIIATIAAWSTILRRGPFVRGTLNESLLFLQAFTAVIALTSMALVAVLSERKRVEARLAESNDLLLAQIAIVREAKRSEERRRLAEAALASENARLYAAELDARRQAEAAAELAEAANRAKTSFLAVMSHELRTPLNAVIGYTDLIVGEFTGPINETQRAHLGRVRASAQHLIALVEGVLALARGDAVSEELHIEPLDACSLGRQSAALMEEAVVAKGLVLALDVPDTPHLIETDATRVRQILINLLSNAIKFTERGTIGLAVRPSAASVAFEVRDTGIGIASHHHEQIFEPFWQVDQSMTRRTGGTGLGLGVTRQLARLLGGDVAVASAPGSGSTFSVVLPVRRA